MCYTYRDITEFQEKCKTRKEREARLRAMSMDEVLHLARTCGNITTAACFMQFAKRIRNQLEEQAADSER